MNSTEAARTVLRPTLIWQSGRREKVLVSHEKIESSF